MHKMNLAPQLSSCATAELGTGTEWEKRGSELGNTFVPPQCWAGLGLFSASQGSEHPPGVAYAAHVNWGTSGQWKIQQAEECSSCPVPSLPHPALTPSTPGSVAVAVAQLLGTPAPSLILHTRQRLCWAGTGCMNHHMWKAQSQLVTKQLNNWF